MEVNLNLSKVNGELSQFQRVPEGIYDLTVTNAEWKQTTAKTGSYFSLSLQVVSGSHKGKVFSQNLTVENPSEKAVEIGLRTIKQILTQIGHANPDMLGNINEFINGNSFRGIIELESFVGKDGSVGQSSSLKSVVSKEVELKDGVEEAKSTRPSTAKAPSAPKAAPTAPAPSPVAAKPATPAAPAAPAATPSPAAKPAWMQQS